MGLWTKYTMTLLDALEADSSFLDFLPNEGPFQGFHEVFVGRWGIYELGGETLPEAKLYLKQVFDVHVRYYLEQLAAYATRIDMLDGNVRDYETTNIELPNKQTSKEYPSSKTIIHETGGVPQIELKEAYLRHIRNILLNFADRFDDCFIKIYY